MRSPASAIYAQRLACARATGSLIGMACRPANRCSTNAPRRARREPVATRSSSTSTSVSIRTATTMTGGHRLAQLTQFIREFGIGCRRGPEQLTEPLGGDQARRRRRDHRNRCPAARHLDLLPIRDAIKDLGERARGVGCGHARHGHNESDKSDPPRPTHSLSPHLSGRVQATGVRARRSFNRATSSASSTSTSS